MSRVFENIKERFKFLFLESVRRFFLLKKPPPISREEIPESTVPSVSLYLEDLGLEAIIRQTNGLRTFANEKRPFIKLDDWNYRNWNLDVPGTEKAELTVKPWGIKKDGTLKQLFGCFGVPFDRLVLNQEQVLVVLRHHRELLLMNGTSNLFLLKIRGELFVFRLNFVPSQNGYVLRTRRLRDIYTLKATHQRHLIVPKLEKPIP